jgi:hypothetical protein
VKNIFILWVVPDAGTAMTIGGGIAGRNGEKGINPNETVNGASHQCHRYV